MSEEPRRLSPKKQAKLDRLREIRREKKERLRARRAAETPEQRCARLVNRAAGRDPEFRKTWAAMSAAERAAWYANRTNGDANNGLPSRVQRVAAGVQRGKGRRPDGTVETVYRVPSSSDPSRTHTVRTHGIDDPERWSCNCKRKWTGTEHIPVWHRRKCVHKTAAAAFERARSERQAVAA